MLCRGRSLPVCGHRRIDVMTAADAEMIQRDDEDHLALAHKQGRALYSFNVRDFYRIHAEWIAAERDHSGIILAERQQYSVGEQIRRLSLLIETLSAEDMRNRVEFLSGW
jgi:Domain of unknown function (DUF5615)